MFFFPYFFILGFTLLFLLLSFLFLFVLYFQTKLKFVFISSDYLFLNFLFLYSQANRTSFICHKLSVPYFLISQSSKKKERSSKHYLIPCLLFPCFFSFPRKTKFTLYVPCPLFPLFHISQKID